MRTARTTDLKTHTIAVLTARVTERELKRWFPVELQTIHNPYEMPEPAKAAVIQLGSGAYCVLLWCAISQRLMLRIPAPADVTAFLAVLFAEVPMPRTRLQWLHGVGKLRDGKPWRQRKRRRARRACCEGR